MKTILCRCEDVTLEDALEAIEKGHRDVESLKRYTGFATGYCQGKACLAHFARLAALHGAEAKAVTPRPPVYPTPLGFYAAFPDEPDGEAE